MPSPFPGMNPYLEQNDAWHDFHETFIPLARDAINVQIVPNYFAKIDEHLYVHEFDYESRRLLGRADVALASQTEVQGQEHSTQLLEAPGHVWVSALDIEALSYIEIRDRHKRQLITVIELLSPSNKTPGPDREQYLAKRNQLLASRVNFVEIDLLRGGPRMPWEKLPPCDYYAVTSRALERPRADIWAVRLRDPLPDIPIPLRPDDTEAKLNLQPLLHRIYDSAGYEVYIYDGQPDPPLSPDDAEWAKRFLPPSS